MVEGRVIDIKAISDLASMPPKEEIYAKLALPDQCQCYAPGQLRSTAWDAIWRSCSTRPGKKTSLSSKVFGGVSAGK